MNFIRHCEEVKPTKQSKNRLLHSLCSFAMTIILFHSSAFAADPFKNGETITYAVKQWGFPVGQATLSLAGAQEFQGKKTVLIIFKADGKKFYDEEKIYVDPDSFYPLFVERDLNIFGKKEKISERYDQNKVTITKQSGDHPQEQVLTKSGQIENIYGFIFRCRKQGSFKSGEVLDVHLPTQEIKIQVVRKTRLSAGGKYFESFMMESNPSKYQIWFDTSDKKIPLRIDGAVGWSNTVMVMTKYKE